MELDYKAEYVKIEREQEMEAERCKFEWKRAVEGQANKAMYHSKESLVQALKRQISSNPKQANKALITIYGNQTTSEQNTEQTIEYNGIGFSGKDAKFLTSLAKNLMKYGSLTEKQQACVSRIMPRYAGQLIEMSIKSGKIKKIGSYYTW